MLPMPDGSVHLVVSSSAVAHLVLHAVAKGQHPPKPLLPFHRPRAIFSDSIPSPVGNYGDLRGSPETLRLHHVSWSQES